MNPRAPEIGFDRFVQIDWIIIALRVRAGQCGLDDLNAGLEAAGLGAEARIKTRTKLNALVLEPRPDLADFIRRGAQLCSERDESDVLPFAWGAALATYPYFGRVSEFTGRLTALQGDCAASEIHRRISEIYGDREITKRATQAVLQSQANWGVVKRVERGKRLIRLPARGVANHEAIAWLIEAALRFQGRSMSLSTLQSAATLYPFVLDQSLAFVVSRSPSLELHTEGGGREYVALA